MHIECNMEQCVVVQTKQTHSSTLLTRKVCEHPIGSCSRASDCNRTEELFTEKDWCLQERQPFEWRLNTAKNDRQFPETRFCMLRFRQRRASDRQPMTIQIQICGPCYMPLCRGANFTFSTSMYVLWRSSLGERPEMRFW